MLRPGVLRRLSCRSIAGKDKGATRNAPALRLYLLLASEYEGEPPDVECIYPDFGQRRSNDLRKGSRPVRPKLYNEIASEVPRDGFQKIAYFRLEHVVVLQAESVRL